MQVNLDDDQIAELDKFREMIIPESDYTSQDVRDLALTIAAKVLGSVNFNRALESRAIEAPQ